MSDLQAIATVSCQLVEASASDLNVVNAARISLDVEHPELDDMADVPLIRYLLRERHGSPFEHTYFKFKVEAPIFVFREHHRHRVGHSYNEMSGRYVELAPNFYVPGKYRTQTGKPGAYVFEDLEPLEHIATYNGLDRVVMDAYEVAWNAYETLLREGIAKEQARIVLPVGLFSKMLWTCNARSLMHFLGLRNAPTAQAEIRMVAEQAEEALAQHMPHTYAAFIDNDRVAP